MTDEHIAACVKRASTYGLPFVGLLNPGGKPSDFSKRFTAEILALCPAQMPEGYALVPIEPTEEMLLAYTGGAITDAGFRWCRHQWSAMLAAPPAQKGDEHRRNEASIW